MQSTSENLLSSHHYIAIKVFFIQNLKRTYHDKLIKQFFNLINVQGDLIDENAVLIFLYAEDLKFREKIYSVY